MTPMQISWNLGQRLRAELGPDSASRAKTGLSNVRLQDIERAEADLTIMEASSRPHAFPFTGSSDDLPCAAAFLPPSFSPLTETTQDVTINPSEDAQSLSSMQDISRSTTLTGTTVCEPVHMKPPETSVGAGSSLTPRTSPNPPCKAARVGEDYIHADGHDNKLTTLTVGGAVIAFNLGVLALDTKYDNATTRALLSFSTAFSLLGICAAAWVPRFIQCSTRTNGWRRLRKALWHALWCVPTALLLPAVFLSAAGFIAEMVEISPAMAIAVSCIFVFGAFLCITPLVLLWWVNHRPRKEASDTGES